MVGEVPVDRDLHAADVHGHRLYPGGLAGRRLLAVPEPPEHQDIGDDVGTCGAAMRRGGQPDRRGEFPEPG